MASLTAINCDSSANLYPLIKPSKSINRVLSNCFSDWQATHELQESWTSNGSSSSHSGHFLTPNLTVAVVVVAAVAVVIVPKKKEN